MNNLKFWREQKGYTTRQLALLSGVSKSTINDLENGVKSGKNLTWIKIANALKISKDKLIDYDYNDPIGNLIVRLIKEGVIEDSANISENATEIILKSVKEEIDRVKKILK